MRKKLLIRSLLIVVLTAMNLNLSAQTTIGSDEPASAGTLLDLKQNGNLGANSIKGLGLPRVNLTDMTNLYPMFTGNSDYENNINNKKSIEDKKHIGLTVYNSEPSKEGLYIWNGAKWDPAGSSKISQFTINKFTASGGTLVVFTPVIRGSVVQVVEVDVKEEGAYYIETERIDGLRYTASGYFSETDVKNSANNIFPTIVLIAEGTPEKIGIYDLKFLRPTASFSLKPTVNSQTSSFFVSLTSTNTEVYSGEPYTLTATTMNNDKNKTTTYKWYENGEWLQSETQKELNISHLNNTAINGKFVNVPYTYVCLVTVEGQGTAISEAYTVTVLPPWGQGGIIKPGIEAKDPQKLTTYRFAYLTCQSYGTGWRLPLLNEAIKLCAADIVPSCKNSPFDTVWIGNVTHYDWSTNTPNLTTVPAMHTYKTMASDGTYEYRAFEGTTGTPSLELGFFCVRGY